MARACVVHRLRHWRRRGLHHRHRHFHVRQVDVCVLAHQVQRLAGLTLKSVGRWVAGADAVLLEQASFHSVLVVGDTDADDLDLATPNQSLGRIQPRPPGGQALRGRAIRQLVAQPRIATFF